MRRWPQTGGGVAHDGATSALAGATAGVRGEKGATQAKLEKASRIFSSWNRIVSWLRWLQGLQAAA